MRAILAFVPVLAAGACAFFYGFFVEPNNIAVREIEVCDSRASTALEKAKIVFLSDIHYKSEAPERRRMEKISSIVERLNPDIVLLGGDYVFELSQTDSFNMTEVAAFLANLKNKCGIFAVMGNLESIFGHGTVGLEMARRAVKILDNSSAVVNVGKERINIAGVSCFSPDTSRAFARADKALPTIFLTYSPDDFESLEFSPSIALAGHTHGGQLRMPFWNLSSLLSKYGGKYERGLVRSAICPRKTPCGKEAQFARI